MIGLWRKRERITPEEISLAEHVLDTLAEEIRREREAMAHLGLDQ